MNTKVLSWAGILVSLATFACLYFEMHSMQALQTIIANKTASTTWALTRNMGASIQTADSNLATESLDELPLMTVITAFSSNHLMEGVQMIRSLTDVKYTGPFFVYLMHRPGEVLPDEMRLTLTQELLKSPLNVTVVHYEVVEEYHTYCFKPKVIQDYLTHAALTNQRPKVLHWVDTSIRFNSNPVKWATAILRDGIDFAGSSGSMGMGENTHAETQRYLNISAVKYKHKREMLGGVWAMNLDRQGLVSNVLTPWVDCASRACHACMSPLNSSRTAPKGTRYQGPPSTKYVAHRQDQSVLNLLVLQCEASRVCNVRVSEPQYLDVVLKRKNNLAKSIQEINM